MSSLPTNLAAHPEKLIPVVVQEDEQLHVFKSRQPYVKYAFQDGREAEFLKEPGKTTGVYYTNQQELIDELNYQISKRHPLIFVDANEVTILAEDRDPKVRQRKQLVAELMAEGWVKTDPSNDMGNSIQGPLNAGSTTSIAAVSAGGDGANDAARLSALASKLSEKASASKKFVPPAAVTELPPEA